MQQADGRDVAFAPEQRGQPTWRSGGKDALERDEEKWKPVFLNNHATTNSEIRMMFLSIIILIQGSYPPAARHPHGTGTLAAHDIKRWVRDAGPEERNPCHGAQDRIFDDDGQREEAMDATKGQIKWHQGEGRVCGQTFADPGRMTIVVA